MMKPIIPAEDATAPNEKPSRNDAAKKISAILKHTNQLIRQGELDLAQGELIQANRDAKQQFKNEITNVPLKQNILTTKTDLTPLPLKPIEALINTISSSKQKINTPPKPTNKPSITTEQPLPQPAEQTTNNRKIELDYYRDALFSAWSDGSLTDEEKRQLLELRTVLEISDNEHETIEKEIKKACFKDAANQFLTKGSTSVSNAKSLNEIRTAFHISEEDSIQIRDQLLCSKENGSQDRILVIDDDAQFLELLDTSLTNDGFDATAVCTSDEAYTLLQQNVPDLILCDVDLKTSSMDGFTFYKKLQDDKQLQQIPFVFLTGMLDENLAQTGRELGADDYLTKPISIPALTSALRGRIKRFKQLKGSYDFQ